MLSAQAYSFRQKSKLAISLSWIGGYTNVVALLSCKTLISHVTGTTTWAGEAAAYGDFAVAGYFAFLLATFFAGAVLSALLTEGARRRGVRSKYILPLLLEAGLLIVFAIGLESLTRQRAAGAGGELGAAWLLVGAAAMAMGLQNATITRILGNVVRTTHLTGVVTDLGIESVQYAYWWRDRARTRRASRRGRLLRVSRRHPSVLRLLLLASIFGSFLLGVVVGTLLYVRWPGYVMILPVGFLLFIVVMDFVKPIADARELDLLKDSELKAFGIVQSLLSKELGIYRMGPYTTHGGAGHKGPLKMSQPDFAGFVDRLHARWRVVILALTPLVRLSPNSLMELADAVGRMRKDGRKLIVCGITPVQWKALDKAGVLDELGEENVCPDLEFAVARAVEVLGPAAARAVSR
ncbi:MAG TPA: YoaK family protein [Tepidisphaeraceae bacterium]|nr:YoaK family protein [Tepidisphaeraceae bacterium]